MDIADWGETLWVHNMTVEAGLTVEQVKDIVKIVQQCPSCNVL